MFAVVHTECVSTTYVGTKHEWFTLYTTAMKHVIYLSRQQNVKLYNVYSTSFLCQAASFIQCSITYYSATCCRSNIIQHVA